MARGQWKRKRSADGPRRNASQQSYGQRTKMVKVTKDGFAASVSEASVGIRAFRSLREVKITGLVKKRFSDFHVNEIGLDGSVCHLTAIPMPLNPIKSHRTIVNEWIAPYVGDEENRENEVSCTLAFEHIKNRMSFLQETLSSTTKRLEKEKMMSHLKVVVESMYGMEVAHSLQTFVADEQHHDKASEKSLRLPPSGKLFRKQLHEALREHTNGWLTAEITEPQENETTDPSQKPMLLRISTQKDKMDFRNRRAPDQKDYTQFVLYKENLDTMNAMKTLCDYMNIKNKVLTYAGTKDKRGITTQYCVGYRVDKRKLLGVNRRLVATRQNMALGHFQYVDAPLALGDSLGNQFTIALRNVTVHDPFIISQAVRDLGEKGFVNYFGLQRFGTSAIPSHDIGRAILQRNWQKAVDLIMKPRRGDPSSVQEAREAFAKDQNVDKALNEFPKFLLAEQAILQSFKHQGMATATLNANGKSDDFRRALDGIPAKLRMLYTHAYQSYVWNEAVTARLTMYDRDAPVVGDLVLEDPQADLMNPDFDPEVIDALEEDDVDLEKSSVVGKKKVVDTKVKVLSQQDLDSQRYSMFDVILPLPGFDVQYPTNSIKETYSTFLENDGIEFSKPDRSHVEMHLSGNYRHIIKRVANVSHWTMRYNDPDAPLLQSEKDRILGIPPPMSIPDGTFEALCLRFELGPGSYATMVLRELMQQNLDIASQMELNNSLALQSMPPNKEEESK